MQYYMNDSCYGSLNLSSKCLPYPYQQLWETKSLCRAESGDQRPKRKSRACSAALEKRRQCIPRSHFKGWRIAATFIWPVTQKRESWMACPNVTEEENYTAQSGWSVSHARHVLQLEWTWPSCTKRYDGQWPVLYCAPLQSKVRRAVRRKPEVLENGVILLQDNATPYHHRDVQSLVERWGWEVLGHRPNFPDLAPCSDFERASSG